MKHTIDVIQPTNESRFNLGHPHIHSPEVVTDQPKLLQHKIINILGHHAPNAQRAQNPPNTSNLARNATNTTQPSDSGRNTFHPTRINWS